MIDSPNVIAFRPRQNQAALRRPRILIRAAREGQAGWRRDRDLPRLLRSDHCPLPGACLSRLRAEGVDVVPITWALVKELRTLYQAALAARANRLDAYLGKIFLPAPRKRALASAARRAEPRRLARLLSQAARLDAINKGAAGGRAWDELITLTIALSGATPTIVCGNDPFHASPLS